LDEAPDEDQVALRAEGFSGVSGRRLKSASLAQLSHLLGGLVAQYAGAVGELG
jgi:hypothetical protein